ncbi:hypothetical protein C8J42_101920 [Sphingomonas sp. PP-CE-1A-559]|uniref:hypothetical protein n=1 Tax=Sphingomonas sp. PP-CE-1A-559 TaxID=2135657 RepID=UPI001055F8A1|nr:hypothetical protein [Sphingomonas sp. PP-CE-1A-559]TCP94454.1 hypothetical protein C8J42_101920 [Sphingomonas sp. PP-CE-1A-559]
MASRIANYGILGSAICQEAKAAGRQMVLEVGMLGDFEFNAVAHKIDGVDLIGMNAGVFLRLASIFEALLATRHAFPELGTVESRSSVPWSKEAAILGPPGPSGAKLDRESPENYAIQIFVMLGERFIFEHEATHVRHGHVDWAQSRFGAQPFDELRMASVNQLSGLDLQTLEFDADCGGIQGVMEFIYTIPGKMGKDAPPGWAHFGDMRNLIKATSFAIYTCCQIFADATDDDPLDVILTRSHPPATFRMHCVSGQLFTVIGTHFYSHMHADLFSAVLEGISEAHMAWQEVFGGSETWHELRTRHEDRNRELLQMLQDNWATLYPSLNTLKRYGNLSPPDGLNAWPNVTYQAPQ